MRSASSAGVTALLHFRLCQYWRLISTTKTGGVSSQLQIVFDRAERNVWREDMEESVHQAQEKLWYVWKLLSAMLPVCRDLDIDWSQPVKRDVPLLEKFWSVLRQIPTERQV